MRNDIMRRALGVMLAAPCIAWAQSAMENLTRIESETTVLKAQARKLEVQAQIATKQAEIERIAGTAAPGDPTVRSVEGIGRMVYATLQLENGSTLEVKEGDTLPDGTRVVFVRLNEVILETPKKRRVRLSGTSPMQPSSPYSMAALPVPMGSPVRGLK